MATLILHTPQGDTAFSVETGALLADALLTHGHSTDRPCGGIGRCGKCRVRATGVLSELSDPERACLSAGDLARSVRLACCARVLGDVEVWMDAVVAHQIRADGIAREVAMDPLFSALGAAVDIGTTTLAAQLFDTNGRLATAAAPNGQGRYGADVISRIGLALNGEAAALAACIRQDVSRLLTQVCQRAGRGVEDLDALVITGNTAMLYLLTGESVAPLAAAPFHIEEKYGRTVTAGELGLCCRPEVPVYLPRCMAAFVGADITTAQLASGLCDADGTALLADIGTNGELTLWHKGTLTVCSTAAGPAFEAANLSCGMQGVDGAIDRVWIQDDRLCIHTIGDRPAAGICGSGVADLVACLLRQGRLDETGYLEEGQVTLAEGVTFTQEDVRQVQLAKSAIRSGIETLLHEHGLSYEQVDRFVIAGGFGSYMSLDSAAAMGLIPPALTDRCYSIGNAALAGAAMLLCGRSLLATSAAVADEAVSTELASNLYFVEQYMEQMMF